MANFNAARWIADAFAAGIDARLDAAGHLVTTTLYGENLDEIDRLEAALDDPARVRAIRALLPRPGTDARLLH